MTTFPLQGRPVRAELLTTDPAAAKAFYTAVIGWTYKPFETSHTAGDDLPSVPRPEARAPSF
jgi:predicted enzyme related to lactoylglutathione lyase